MDVPTSADLIGLTDRGGPDGGVPLVLLHGWTGSRDDFAGVVGPLAEDRRVLAPDLPGHGATPPGDSADAYALGAVARWVVAVLDGLGVGDVHLLGHSLGGLLAQRVASLAAHRISSLTLVGTGLGAVNEDSAERIVAIATAARDQGMAAAWELVMADADLAAPDPREAMIRRRFLAMTPEAVVGGARALVTSAPLGAFLRGMDFPVLVCHGEGDTAWLPHEQRLLARTITGARYAVIPDALHTPTVENPSATLDLLRPFLAAAD